MPSSVESRSEISNPNSGANKLISTAGQVDSSSGSERTLKPSLGFRFDVLTVQTIVVVALTLLGLETLARLLAVVGQWDPQRSDEYQCKLALARAKSNKPTLFFLGSSFTAKAIYTDYLKSRLQERGAELDAVNLAMLASKPQVQLALLDQSISAGRKPQAVFYDVSPIFGYMASLEKRRLQPSPYVPYLLVYRDRLAAIFHTLPQVIASPQMVPPGGFGVKSVHMSAAGWEPSLDVANGQMIRGTVVRRKRMSSEESEHPEFFEHLAPLKDYCAAHNVPLIFVWYPASAETDALYAGMGLSKESFLSLFNQKAKEWNVGFLDLHTPIDVAYLHDCDHINAAGAVKVTTQMCDLIVSSEFAKLCGHH